MTTDLEHRLGLGSADGVKRALRTWADRDGETTPLGNAAADLIERQERTIADLTAQRDASISDVVSMGALYDKCAAKDATIADLTAALTTLKARWPNFFGAEDHKIIDAALARAKGGQT